MDIIEERKPVPSDHESNFDKVGAIPREPSQKLVKIALLEGAVSVPNFLHYSAKKN